MTDSEKVEILFKEYNTLRAEILQRVGHRFQFLAIFGAIGAFVLFQTQPVTTGQLIVVIAAIVVVLSMWLLLGHIIAACSTRIAKIEQRINELAGEDELLHWESSLVDRSLFHRLHAKINGVQENVIRDSHTGGR